MERKQFINKKTGKPITLKDIEEVAKEVFEKHPPHPLILLNPNIDIKHKEIAEIYVILKRTTKSRR